MESVTVQNENNFLDNCPPKDPELDLIKQLRESIFDLNISEEDGTNRNLVRFIRARNGNVNDAALMFRNNYHWRQTEDIKHLLLHYECPKGWEKKFYYKMTGFDRTGCPVLVAPIGKYDIQKELAMKDNSKEEIKKFLNHTMEEFWALQQRLSEGQDYMKRTVGIVDLEGLSFRQVASIDVVEVIKQSLQVFEANYPEVLKSVLVLNAPWPFKIIWKLIRPFVSERTHAKLVFLGGNKEKWRESILNLCEPDQFPEYYGGTAPDTTEGVTVHGANRKAEIIPVKSNLTNEF